MLSAFADEGIESKNAEQQIALLKKLGLEYYSIRFVDVGGGVKNIMKLESEELKRLKLLHREHGIKVASIGSPIGKVKLIDIEDGTKNAYVPFWQYLEEDVLHAVRLAEFFETNLIRGFSFYHPKGSDRAQFVSQATEQVGKIAELCRRHGVTFGLEIEANLVGDSAAALVAMAEEISSPALVLVFDGGNLAAQNLSAEECFAQYKLMRDYLGWIHVKDYKIDPKLVWQGHVDEERLKNFVPCGTGDAGYPLVLEDLRQFLPYLDAKQKAKGVPGFFLELEPHLRGGGQFGGFSGPDGMETALGALKSTLDQVAIPYRRSGNAS